MAERRRSGRQDEYGDSIKGAPSAAICRRRDYPHPYRRRGRPIRADERAAASRQRDGDHHNAVLLTVFLKHGQSRPLGELNAQLAKQGFYKAFPPPGIEVVSWYVEMGIGQVITLRLPASRLREVNRILEDTAWGAYHTEFYPTYDYKPIGMAEHEKAQ